MKFKKLGIDHILFDVWGHDILGAIFWAGVPKRATNVKTTMDTYLILEIFNFHFELKIFLFYSFL